jgi:SAM-dependent methyltransferase
MIGPPDVPAGAVHAPHTLRNRDPILAVLRRALAGASAVLEIGCGPGEQAPYFAAALPHLRWLSTDVDAEAVASAAAWRGAAQVPNVLAPMRLDVARSDWPLPPGFTPDAIVSINMIHIAPFAACEGLMAGAGRLLPPDGVLYLYGPYRVGGAHTAPSNAAFDRSLRARNPAWGIRDLGTVIDEAARHGMVHAETVPMPANNLSLVFRKV